MIGRGDLCESIVRPWEGASWVGFPPDFDFFRKNQLPRLRVGKVPVDDVAEIAQTSAGLGAGMGFKEVSGGVKPAGRVAGFFKALAGHRAGR